MEENQNVINSEPAKSNKAGAAVKEWFRKKIVTLKRKTHMIPLFVTLVASIIYLLCLRTYSKSALDNYAADWLGIAVFVNTLFSVLVLVLFLNAFPKRKKPNIIMIALVFVFMVVMILLDVLYYVSLSGYLATLESAAQIYYDSLNCAIVHIVFVALAGILLATLPLYKKLIMKINTRKVLEENQIKEAIDTEDDV